jgi:outer membrane protein assembly factor BamA
MMKDWKYFISVLAAIFFYTYSFAQLPQQSDSSFLFPPKKITPQKIKLPSTGNTTSFIIGDIFINGNKRTKNYIIERELSFKRGDTISLSALVFAFEKGRERLINTHLFNEAIVYLKGSRGYVMDIQIDVKERWYIFPLPYFRPVDRNLSVWQENNYSLSRVNYGIKYTQYNFTGRNDNLIAWLITGYSRQVELAYDQPYADKSLKHGFGFTFIYAAQKQMDAFTTSNEQYFIKADTISYAGKYLSEQYTFSLRYYYRPALKTKHLIRFGINKISIDSALTVYNPNYFSNNKRQVFFPEISYVLNYTDVDYVPYPLKGITIETGFLRRGINSDMNLWQAYFKNSLSWPIAHKLYFTTQNWSLIKLPFKQPFYNQQLMGYGDFYLRGLDKYVVDGVAAVMIHNTFMRELFNFNIPFLHASSHDHIPFRIYATAFTDEGYAYNKYNTGNSLQNNFLYTGGFGLDIVSFYDFTFKLDYSFNQLGQKGLFLRIGNEF